LHSCTVAAAGALLLLFLTHLKPGAFQHHYGTGAG